jgi:hypothetical protein
MTDIRRAWAGRDIAGRFSVPSTTHVQRSSKFKAQKKLQLPWFKPAIPKPPETRNSLTVLWLPLVGISLKMAAVCLAAAKTWLGAAASRRRTVLIVRPVRRRDAAAPSSAAAQTPLGSGSARLELGRWYLELLLSFSSERLANSRAAP